MPAELAADPVIYQLAMLAAEAEAEAQQRQVPMAQPDL
jgi:hypothetical protein